MPRKLKSLRTAEFIGGPLDGTTALSLGHDHVIRATLEDDGATRHWHWYELCSEGDVYLRYRYVGDEVAEWPSRFGDHG